MNIKVKALDGIEPKGVQELEEELLKKHEQQNDGDTPPADTPPADTPPADTPPADTPPADTPPVEDELTVDKVLSYLGKKYNKQINSLDELMAARNDNSEELPEDVAAYLKFKKETGRGINDFIKLNTDYDAMEPDQLLRDYLASTQKGLDKEDIDTLMEELTYDETLDSEERVKRTKIARKKAIAEAKEYFNGMKEKYKLPLESRANGLPPEEEEGYKAYREYVNQAKTLQEQNARKSQWFQQKTDEVFSKDFKGFELTLGNKKVFFSPGSPDELKKLQSNPLNFVSKYLDKDGLISDAQGYHKALALAMNPDKFIQFVYEQGAADALDGNMREIKNINMGERRVPEATKKGGLQVKAVAPDQGKGLKIRSIKTK